MSHHLNPFELLFLFFSRLSVFSSCCLFVFSSSTFLIRRRLIFGLPVFSYFLRLVHRLLIIIILSFPLRIGSTSHLLVFPFSRFHPLVISLLTYSSFSLFILLSSRPTVFSSSCLYAFLSSAFLDSSVSSLHVVSFFHRLV